MASIQKNTPIGLKLPIRCGPVNGYFDQTLDTFSAYKMNIINLIRTVPGEIRMNPRLGCRLWNVVFDQNDDLLAIKIDQIIKEDINQWVPGVSVSSVSVKYYNNDQSTDLRDIYKLYIIVKFVVDSIKQEDVVEIMLDINKL